MSHKGREGLCFLNQTSKRVEAGLRWCIKYQSCEALRLAFKGKSLTLVIFLFKRYLRTLRALLHWRRPRLFATWQREKFLSGPRFMRLKNCRTFVQFSSACSPALLANPCSVEHFLECRAVLLLWLSNHCSTGGWLTFTRTHLQAEQIDPCQCPTSLERFRCNPPCH